MRIILFILILVSYAHAETTVIENYEFYEISAVSGSALISELDSNSPILIDGKVYHAYTDTHIEWTFRWRYENDECHISRVNTTVNILYTLPKRQGGNPDPKSDSIWDRWYHALKKHEKNHAELAIETARELEFSISQLPAYSDCEMLANDANQLGNNSIQMLEYRHRDYDRRTNHGESEGARLSSYFEQ